jgi:hypothetical protein
MSEETNSENEEQVVDEISIPNREVLRLLVFGAIGIFGVVLMVLGNDTSRSSDASTLFIPIVMVFGLMMMLLLTLRIVRLSNQQSDDS